MVSRATCTITSPSSSTSWRLETGKKVYTITNHTHVSSLKKNLVLQLLVGKAL